MKLDWKKTFVIGFGFLGTMVLWQIYNAFVPIFLQTGPAFFVLGLVAMTLVTRGEARAS
jgi:hypothetical protein